MPKDEDPSNDGVDEDLPEHVMFVHDWFHSPSTSRFLQFYHGNVTDAPESILINGKGRYMRDEASSTPVHVYQVTSGRSYRFRAISNGNVYCPIQISIDGHNLTMVASDGQGFEARLVETFTISSGERYDFVLRATRPVGSYWVRARGLGTCQDSRASQLAILRYSGAPETDPAGGTSYSEADRPGLMLNPWNRNASHATIPVSELTALAEDDVALKPIPDHRFYLPMDFYQLDNPHFNDANFYPVKDVLGSRIQSLPQISHISNAFPASPPLSQWQDLDQAIFCNESSVRDLNCSRKYCECVHRLQVALGDVVEVVLVDAGVTYDSLHPMHLHGHKFRVIGMGKLGSSTSLEEIKRLDEAGRLPRKLKKAVVKDTVTVPDGGYTIIRFHANNPGVWFFHCHIEFHVDVGMGMFIQVGDARQFPRVPRHFPRCGSWREEHEDPLPPSSASASTAVTPGSLVTMVTRGSLVTIVTLVATSWLSMPHR